MTSFFDPKNADAEISTVRASVVKVIENLNAERGALAGAVALGTAADVALSAEAPTIATPVLTAEEAEQVALYPVDYIVEATDQPTPLAAA